MQLAHQENPVLQNCAIFLKENAHQRVFPAKSCESNGGYTRQKIPPASAENKKASGRCAQTQFEMNFSDLV